MNFDIDIKQIVPERIKSLLREGKKIEALKELRAEKKLGLKQAKEIIDMMDNQH